MTNDKLADEPLIAKGISRLADAGRAVGIAFNRRPTDDEMRMIHDLLRDPFALRTERPQSGEMVMVPIKPTKAMLEVGLREWSAARSNGVEEVHTIYRAMIYTAALAAAEAETKVEP